MAKKKQISDEMREAIRRLNDILDELDLEHYPLNDRQLELLQDFLDQLADPVSHRPVENLVRDAIIAAEVSAKIETGMNKQAAYTCVADALAGKEVYLDEARVGQIYRKYCNESLVRALVPHLSA